jgi:hypothetical protein
MRTIGLVALGLALGLAGCGGASSGAWVKPGVTEEQRGKDTLECLTDSSAMVPGPSGPRQVVNQDRYRRCMMDRGYTAPTN